MSVVIVGDNCCENSGAECVCGGWDRGIRAGGGQGLGSRKRKILSATVRVCVGSECTEVIQTNHQNVKLRPTIPQRFTGCLHDSRVTLTGAAVKTRFSVDLVLGFPLV